MRLKLSRTHFICSQRTKPGILPSFAFLSASLNAPFSRYWLTSVRLLVTATLCNQVKEQLFFCLTQLLFPLTGKNTTNKMVKCRPRYTLGNCAICFILCSNFVANCSPFNNSNGLSVSDGIQTKMKRTLGLMLDLIDTKRVALVYDKEWTSIGEYKIFDLR